MLLCAILLTIIASLYFSIYGAYQPQGRYLLPSFSSFILLLIMASLDFKYKQIGKIFLQIFAVFIAISCLYSIGISIKRYQWANESLWNIQLLFLFISFMIGLYFVLKYKKVQYALLLLLLTSFAYFSYISNWKNLAVFETKEFTKTEEKNEQIESFVMNTLEKQNDIYLINSKDLYLPLTLIKRKGLIDRPISIAWNSQYYSPLQSLNFQAEGVKIERFLIPMQGIKDQEIVLELGNITEKEFTIFQKIKIQRIDSVSSKASYYRLHRFDAYIWTEIRDLNPQSNASEHTPNSLIFNGTANASICKDGTFILNITYCFDCFQVIIKLTEIQKILFCFSKT